jgi:GrpB-like predicted nucleotidyltransferase (UPF0157 family)
MSISGDPLGQAIFLHSTHGSSSEIQKVTALTIFTIFESHFEHWDRLLFRDYLIEHPDVAEEYSQLKNRLAATYPHDRLAYTEGKTEFVVRVIEQAKRYYGKT